MSDLIPFTGLLDPETGALYEDDDDASGMESGRVAAPFFRTARATRIGRRIDRMDRREGRLRARAGLDLPVGDVLQTAQEQGAIVVDQFVGLGRLPLADAATGNLTQQMNRPAWVKRINLTVAGGPNNWGDVDVNTITVAGLPFGLSGGAAPLTMWAHDATGFFLSGQRRFIQVGQQITVNLTNNNGAGQARSIVGGAVVDEPSPYAAQVAGEAFMLNTLMGLPS